MIKEKEINVKINQRNKSYYEKLGYLIRGKEISVNPLDIPKGSNNRITAICEICFSETEMSINKYHVNTERNNKGYYSCFKCKNIEREKTCIEKYGVKSYSQTNEFKETESLKWKGIKKGSEKGKKTMLEKYGVDSWFKTQESKEQNKKWMSSNEFKEKSKKALIEIYGVDSYSKTDKFKKGISENKDVIISKIRNTFIEKYGVDWIFKTEEHKNNYKNNILKIRKKIKNTCVEKYGVENVSQVKEIYYKILETKKMNGIIIKDELLTDWEIYKKKVRNFTNKSKKELYEKWDGYDYYDNEFIKGYLSNTSTSKLYPTIDHKISTFYGFSNNIPVEEIADISNLCITKRSINSSKNLLIEEHFILK